MAIICATALVSAAIGCAVFGRIADVFGRKYIYGFAVLVLGASAIASAFSPNIWWLVAFRFILRLGIGGDYPLSATIASEFAGRKIRGLMISTVFAMQGIGLIVGPLLAMLLIAVKVPEGIVWRILLAAGALPPLAVFWARRHLKEAALRRVEHREGRRHRAEGQTDGLRDCAAGSVWRRPSTREVARRDIGGVVFSRPRILRQHDLQPAVRFGGKPAGERDPRSVPVMARLHVCRGSRLSYVDLRHGPLGSQNDPTTRLCADGRELHRHRAHRRCEIDLVPFIPLYCLNYFFTEFNPNTTTFVFPAEIFPVRVRTTSHGISATIGKIGAAMGTFSFPLLQARFGLPGPMWVAGICCIAGFAVTWALLPEPKGLDFEEASHDSTFSERSVLQPARSA